MKMPNEYLIRYRNDTLWNSKGGIITSNYDTDVIEANSAKEAVAQIYKTYQNIFKIIFLEFYYFCSITVRVSKYFFIIIYPSIF